MDPDPNELLDRLNGLLPAQFAELVFRLQVPPHYLSQRAPQTTCAIEVLQYVMQSGRLSELAALVTPGRTAATGTPVSASEPAAPKRILFLAANPAATTPPALDQEARAIQEELERSGQRDRFVFETRWAVQPLDLLRELRKLRPAVVHFSGDRGPSVARKQRSAAPGEIVGARDVRRRAEDSERGLCFQGADGGAKLVSTAALERTFGAAGSSVKLVVLNACYSEVQAEALVGHVSCVVGMTGMIEDDAARSFSIGFYGGLGEGESVEAAFRQGCAAISLAALGDADGPKLKTRDGVDPSRLILVNAGDCVPPRRS